MSCVHVARLRVAPSPTTSPIVPSNGTSRMRPAPSVSARASATASAGTRRHPADAVSATAKASAVVGFAAVAARLAVSAAGPLLMAGVGVRAASSFTGRPRQTSGVHDRRPPVQRDCAEHDEQRGIPRHLEAELHRRLQRDAREPRSGTEARPVAHGIAPVLSQPPPDAAHARRARDERRDADQQSAFRGELQVVVVCLLEVHVRLGGVVDEAWRCRRC